MTTEYSFGRYTEKNRTVWVTKEDWKKLKIESMDRGISMKELIGLLVEHYL